MTKKKDPVRKSADIVREATNLAEQYAGRDMGFWASFKEDFSKLDDLVETILYVERKKGVSYDKEQSCRWLLNKIGEISGLCYHEKTKQIKQQEKKKKPSKVKDFL